MITDVFDPVSPAVIEPKVDPNAPRVDACILTFSHEIERRVREAYSCRKLGSIWFATGETPVWLIERGEMRFAFYKTYVGAPACVASVEDSLGVVRTRRYLVFGGAGCLDREIARGRVMIPTEAYRDEGTSYHYAPAADTIAVRNASTVAACMEELGVPFVLGKTWTTDAFYRETRALMERRKAQGCVSVEMECAALQAMCDFRGLELYTFFTSGDLLDAPKWDERRREGQTEGTQHDAGHFDIALALAERIVQRNGQSA